jgi:hypothetical protein
MKSSENSTNETGTGIAIVSGIEKIRAAGADVETATNALTKAKGLQDGAADRMNELQERANTVSFDLAKAELVEQEAIGGLQELIRQEAYAKSSYDEAVRVLEEAKVLVREERAKHEDAVSKRTTLEIEIAPTCIEVRRLRTEITKYRTMADGEMARVHAEIANQSEALIHSQLANINAQLEILADPSSLLNWNEIKQVVGA